MNQKVLQTLEFNKIITQLESLTVSPLAKAMARNLKPYADLSTINSKLDETSEACDLIIRQGSLPLGGIKDITGIIKRLQVGGNLSIVELLHTSDLLRITKRIKSYANQCDEYLSTATIAQLFYSLESINPLYREITRCIVSEEELADDASSQLNNIRKEMKATNSKIRQHLNKIISSSNYKTMLQEPIITLKNDRFCVPVKTEHKNNFPGMVHEHSASGSTLFIEPMSVVQLNNQLRQLISDESKEIDRILATLSAMAAENIEVLHSNQNLLSQLDLIFAKGELSLRLKCSKPIFNTDKYINLKKARHPLLDQDTVVPINIHLGDTFNTLVVTGPNTGGKTVTLKTLGLLSLMGQTGLHIPAFDNSSLTIFEEIFADIGDEQSIEQSLSTFSSHMVNIVEILSKVNENSLVLFDELGAGTDPTEGAALAMAILDQLYKKSVLTVATTHYSELKEYALSTQGIENACCEFDVVSLKPTYKLLIGIPGKSNAFAISKRLGLSDNIIDASKELLASKAVRFEDLITDLEINKKTAIYEKEKAQKFRAEAEKLQQQLKTQKEKINQQKIRILKEAKEQSYQILQEAKAEADKIIKEMNSLAKQGTINHKLLEQNRSKLRSSLSSLESDLTIQPKKETQITASDVKKGDTIYVISFEQNGIVLTPPNNKGELQVQLGIMKTKVHLSNIALAEQTNHSTKAKRKPLGNNSSSRNIPKSQYISPEIDVRGKSSDEALNIIDKYLDDAYLANLPQTTIIHGKGTGVLRTSIHSYLRTVKYIKGYRLGNYGEGDSGVTIVDFK